MIDRKKLERDARRKLGKLSQAHLAELQRLLGSPPDPSRVPAEFWARVEDDHRKTLAGILLVAFAGAADEIDGGDLGDVAGVWSEFQAGMTSGRYVATSQARLDRLASRWADDAPLSGELRHGLSGIFGPDRDQTVIGTEITRGIGAGTVAAAKSTQAYAEGRVRLVWTLGDREQHCPICLRLAGSDETVWGLEVESPPIHPQCGCWIDVVTAPAANLIGATV